MFSLLYGLWDYLWRSPEVRVLVVGLDRGGKTTLMERIKVMHAAKPTAMPAKVLPTVGLNMGRVKLSGVEVVMRDLGGQASLRSIWEKYFEEADAVMFVADGADRDRFEEARECLGKLLAADGLASVPFLLVANKIDLQGSVESAELARVLHCDGGTAAANNQCHFIDHFAVSAHTGQGCKALLQACVEAIQKHPRVKPPG